MARYSEKHYSRAIVASAETVTEFEQLIRDLTDVCEKLDGTPDFKQLLTDPHVQLTKKKKALTSVFEDFISHKTYNILQLLMRDKMLLELPSIIEMAKHEQLRQKEMMAVVVESVIPLSAEQEKTIAKVVGDKLGKKIVIHAKIDKHLIGGLRVHVGDTVIDGTITGKIERLQKKIDSLTT